MRKVLIVFLFFIIINNVQAQSDDIYLPIILKGNPMTASPRIVITDGTIEVDLLGQDSGWEMASPYWNPQISQYKRGGTFVNAQLATGSRLVHKEYSNVVETIPLSLRGIDQAKAIKTAHDALSLLRQAGDYWTEPYEYDQVWIEVNLGCNNCLTGYSRIIKGQIPRLTNPFGQPFFSTQPIAVMENLSIIFEREPFWGVKKPGEIIGSLYNFIDNPDFELWNNGIVDSQPDNWTDLETTHITGTNNRLSTGVKFGENALKISVSGSTLSGAAKGVTQNLNDVLRKQLYTVVAWVKSDGVSNGVGRILINHSSQFELYRESNSHGWTLYVNTIMLDTIEVQTVSIDIEILTTFSNTVGTIYVDGLMFLEGDFKQDALDNILPYISGSHIVNHLGDSPGNLNYVDAWHIPGSANSKIRLEFINNTTIIDPSNVIENFAKITIGMRRARNVFIFDNIKNNEGVVDITASNSSRIDITPTNSWQDVSTKIVTNPDITSSNQGRFRLLVRVYDTQSSGSSTLQLRVKYFIGNRQQNNNKILDAINVPIIGNWTTIDLTPNKIINFDRKFSALELSQIGYTIQMRRTSGTDTAYLDFSMIMPTDGGFIINEIDPALGFKAGLAIDTTNVSNIASFLRPQEWEEVFESSSETLQSAIEFNGTIFVAGDGDVYKRESAYNWTKVFDDNNLTMNLVIYNGVLHVYAGSTGGGINSKLYSSDTTGTVWTLVHDFGSAGFSVFDAIVFDNKIFLGFLSEIYTWDGSSLVNQNIVDSAMGIYGNELHALSANIPGEHNVYNPLTKIWRDITTVNTPDQGNAALIEFEGKLIAGRFNTKGVSAWDGSKWEQLFTPTTGIFYWFRSIVVFQNQLYAGNTNVTFTEGAVHVSNDGGKTWELTFVIPSTFDANKLLNTEGVLYLLDSFLFDTGENASVSSLVVEAADTSFPTFRGTPFLAPPRTRTSEKRHRYFFSYNRENFINNIDDKALIGIGFYPQYLELPVKETP